MVGCRYLPLPSIKRLSPLPFCIASAQGSRSAPPLRPRGSAPQAPSAPSASPCPYALLSLSSCRFNPRGSAVGSQWGGSTGLVSESAALRLSTADEPIQQRAYRRDPVRYAKTYLLPPKALPCKPD